MQFKMKKLFSLCALFVCTIASANTYYINPSGKFNNSGLTSAAAWSIEKANQFSFTSDTIVFEERTFGVLNISADDKTVVIKSIGIKATIEGINIYNTGNIDILDLIIIGKGIVAYKDNSEILKHIYIDNVEVSQSKEGIVIGCWETLIGFEDIQITNIKAYDNIKVGIFTYSQNDEYAHKNIYIGNCEAYRNYGDTSVTNVNTGSGIVVSGFDGALIENCKAYDNGKNNRSTAGGPVGIWFYAVKNGIIQNCESYNNKAGLDKDGGGFDLDGGTQNCIIQNCFSHDNEGPGFLLVEYGSPNVYTGNVIRNNISTNDGLKNNSGSLTLYAVDVEHKIMQTVIENNVFTLLNTSPAINIITNNFSDVIIRNNTFYLTATTEQIQGGSDGVQLINNQFIISSAPPIKLNIIN